MCKMICTETHTSHTDAFLTHFGKLGKIGQRAKPHFSPQKWVCACPKRTQTQSQFALALIAGHRFEQIHGPASDACCLFEKGRQTAYAARWSRSRIWSHLIFREMDLILRSVEILPNGFLHRHVCMAVCLKTCTPTC